MSSQPRGIVCSGVATEVLLPPSSEQLRDMRGSVAEISSALPKPATLILHLILGDIPIILPTRTDK